MDSQSTMGKWFTNSASMLVDCRIPVIILACVAFPSCSLNLRFLHFLHCCPKCTSQGWWLGIGSAIAL